MNSGLRLVALVSVLISLPWAKAQVASIDGLRLNGVETLADTPWRYMAADDPRFADPSFADDSWALVSPGASLPRRGALRNEGPLYSWARLHLHVDGPPTRLAVALNFRSVFPYAVYANGRLAAMSPGFERPVLEHAAPFAILLPPDRDITLAIRIFCPRNEVMRSFPLLAVRVGRQEAVVEGARLDRIADFCRLQVSQMISLALSLAVAIFGSTLFLAARSRREYLWLALIGFSFAGMMLSSVLIISGIISAGPLHLLVWRMSGCLANVFLLEFTPLLTGVRPWRGVRALQAIVLLLPLLALYSEVLFSYSLLAMIVLVVAMLGIYFVQALLRRNREAMLLSMPLALLLLGNLLLFANTLYPGKIPFPTLIHIGIVGIGADQLPMWLVFLTTLGIVQYRFVRVSQFEQRTMAELDAARAVQQLLIPDKLPEVPGLRFGSIYQPALQVGGDFFQILPSPAGTLVALGDVSGKGVPAALTVALLLGTLRSAAERNDSPAAILAALNHVTHGRGSGFTTCLLVWINRSAARLVMASAGHLPPYLDGSALALEANLPLGLAYDLEFVEHAFDFRPGQVLTLLTDGVVEAFHPQTRELFGFERTRAVSHLSAACIAAEVAAFTAGQEPSDDITILTIAAA